MNITFRPGRTVSWQPSEGMVYQAKEKEMKQLDLEQMARVITAPYQPHSETSKAAAKEIIAGAGTMRYIVYSYLYAYGPSTDEQMQEGIPMEANTQRPRRRELQQKGLVKDSGEKRKTKSGRQATIWEVV